MSVGDRITELRKKNNMSQAALADAVGVSRQAVSKWETGLSLPDSSKLILLAQILSTDIEYLSTGRVNDAIRPPVVIKTVERVETKVEVPVVKIQEKIVEKVIEKPVIEYIEKPIVRRVIQYRYRRNYLEYAIVGICCFILGLLTSLLF
jgi:transcriptional regulator with XRE-family HTH domain